MSALAVTEKEIDEQDLKKKLVSSKKYNDEEFMSVVSTKEPETYGTGNESIVVVDTGVKNAILRNVRNLGYKVILVPWNYSIEKILSYNLSRVKLSNDNSNTIKSE